MSCINFNILVCIFGTTVVYMFIEFKYLLQELCARMNKNILSIYFTVHSHTQPNQIFNFHLGNKVQHNISHLFQALSVKTLTKRCDISPFTYFLFISFCSFNPATWGHSPKDTEHVKNSCNINKAKYVQSMERR
jgi:hypothetical protein